MLDIAANGSADHFLSETGEAAITTAPIKVAPIKTTFRIVRSPRPEYRDYWNHSASIGTLIRIKVA
jgi:hypothetical protein